MKLIDYDAEFRKYFENWYSKNKDEFEKPEDVEQIIPQIYQQWMQATCKPLMEISGAELVGLIDKYVTAGMDVPDIVTELIVRRAQDTENALCSLYKNNMFRPEIRVLLINMLSEMDCAEVINSFVDIVATSTEDDEITNACAEALANTKHNFLEYGIEAYRKCKFVGSKELLLNSLISKYRDESNSDVRDSRLTDFILTLYSESKNKAFIAAMMGELGDERCLPVLVAATNDKSINYVDYTEICNAIEMLGGEVSREREFEGDVYYEMMKKGDLE